MAQHFEHAVIGLQGGILRSRIPNGIIKDAGGEEGDAIKWVVTGPSRIQGMIVKGGAGIASEERSAKAAEKMAAAREARGTTGNVKKISKKTPAAKKTQKTATSVEDAFAEPAKKVVKTMPKISIPSIKKPSAVAIPKPVPVVVSRPSVALPQQKKVASPLLKPSAKKAAKTGVRYEVPE